MKVKTRELAGAALDWAVAKCKGIDLSGFKVNTCSRLGADYSFKPNGWYIGSGTEYMPTLQWDDGGPIIEEMFTQGLRLHTAEFMIGVTNKNLIVASLNGDVHAGFYFGNTPLIAAMRCFVASRLGDEVEVPDELV